MLSIVLTKVIRRPFRLTYRKLRVSIFSTILMAMMNRQSRNYFVTTKEHTRVFSARSSKNNNLDCLNHDEKTTLAFFFSIQYFRTKEQRISYRELFNCVKDKLTQQCSNEALREDLEACGQESVLKEGHLSAFMMEFRNGPRLVIHEMDIG